MGNDGVEKARSDAAQIAIEMELHNRNQAAFRLQDIWEADTHWHCLSLNPP